MKKVTFVLMVVALVFMNQMTFAKGNKSVVGTWKVTVADAPYEYVNSSLVVSEGDGNLSAKVVFENSQEVTASEIKISEDVLHMTVNIEGNDIKVTGKVENSKITGKVDSPDGVLDLTAVKKI